MSLFPWIPSGLAVKLDTWLYRASAKIDNIKLIIYRSTGSTRRIKINGHTVCIPFIKGLSCSPSEPWMTSLLGRILACNEGLFIDFGVNLGQTLIKLKSVDPLRDYLGFEPNPNCFLYLHYLIQSNEFTQAEILPFAVGKSTRVTSLIFHESNPVEPSASIVDGLRDPNGVCTVTSVCSVAGSHILDDILHSRSIAVIKIDVEGAELEILETLQGYIRASNPIVIIEFLPIYNASNSSRLQRVRAVESLMRGLSYVFFNIVKNIKHEFMSLRFVEQIPISNSLSECDYVLIHSDQLSIVEDLVDNRSHSRLLRFRRGSSVSRPS